jgi:hypothetical protein
MWWLEIIRVQARDNHNFGADYPYLSTRSGSRQTRPGANYPPRAHAPEAGRTLRYRDDPVAGVSRTIAQRGCSSERLVGIFATSESRVPGETSRPQ